MKRRNFLTVLASGAAALTVPSPGTRQVLKTAVVKVRSGHGVADITVPVFESLEQVVSTIGEKETLSLINRGVRIQAADRARASLKRPYFAWNYGHHRKPPDPATYQDLVDYLTSHGIKVEGVEVRT